MGVKILGVWVPAARGRDRARRLLGELSLGKVLGLGSEGDVGVGDVAYLRCVFAHAGPARLVRNAVGGDAPGDAVSAEFDDNLLARHGTVMRDATVGALRCNKPPESPPNGVVVRRQLGSPLAAELRPDQCDQDTLPPYDVLDVILQRYVERDQTIDEMVKEGFDPETVERVSSMVDRSEYKRQQAPVGLKVTSRAFGTGRRMPIAAKYHP